MTQRCGAKTRQGTPCQRAAMPNGRCNLHGGKTPSGIASPHFKTGRYSKYLPAGLLERFQAARNDPELLALRDEIALLDVRLGEILPRATDGESGGAWSRLQATVGELEAAIAARNPAQMGQALGTLREVIQGGAQHEAAWGELLRVIERRRKLVDTERKRLVDLQQQVTAEQAMSLVAALSAAVQECVWDRETRAAISEAFVRLLSKTVE